MLLTGVKYILQIVSTRSSVDDATDDIDAVFKVFAVGIALERDLEGGNGVGDALTGQEVLGQLDFKSLAVGQTHDSFLPQFRLSNDCLDYRFRQVFFS